MAVFQGSRYVKTPAYLQQGTTLTLRMRTRPKYNKEKATYYTWIQGDTIDGVAYRYYKNAQLWWAIMDANPKYMTEIDINPGDVLLIPDYSEAVKLSG